jgi:hypothetical protein
MRRAIGNDHQDSAASSWPSTRSCHTLTRIGDRLSRFDARRAARRWCVPSPLSA